MSLKKGDFVRMHFTGKMAENGEVFDTTKEEVATENNLRTKNMDYEPLVVCVGEGFILPKLEEALEEHDATDSFFVQLSPEDAFGKKRSDHLKLIPMKVFHKQKIQPQPSLRVDIDGVQGVVKQISGNRVIVDFNHPLSGKDIIYDIETLGIITDLEEQAQAVIGKLLGFGPELDVDGKKIVIPLPMQLPKNAQKKVIDEILRLTDAETVEFEVRKPE